MTTSRRAVKSPVAAFATFAAFVAAICVATVPLPISLSMMTCASHSSLRRCLTFSMPTWERPSSLTGLAVSNPTPSSVMMTL